MLILSNGEFNFKIHLEYPVTSLVLCEALCFHLISFNTRDCPLPSHFFFLAVGLKSHHGRKERNEESEAFQIKGRGLALPGQGDDLKRALCPSRVAFLLAEQVLCGLSRLPSLQEDERSFMCKAQEI